MVRDGGTSVAQPRDLSQPVAGVYEAVVTRRMQQQMEQLHAAGWKAIDDEVSEESSPHVLARHIGQAVSRRLAQLPPDRRVTVANQIMASLAAGTEDGGEADTIAEGPRQLLALAEKEAPGVYAVRPLTPLSETALITNAPDDPSLGSELRAELATADRIAICSALS